MTNSAELCRYLAHRLKRTRDFRRANDLSDAEAAAIVRTYTLDDEEIEVILSALQPWRPIETAPQDGTVVIGAWPGYGGSGLHVGAMAFKTDFYVLGGKMWTGWWAKDSGPTAKEPSFWMPMPDAPQ